MLNRQQSKLFTSIAQMYRNRVIIDRGDRVNLQSDEFFHTTNSVFCGTYVSKVVLFKPGSGNEVEIIGER